MKFIELYVKESHRLSLNPLNEKATQYVVGAFIITVALTVLGKVLVMVLMEAKIL